MPYNDDELLDMFSDESSLFGLDSFDYDWDSLITEEAQKYPNVPESVVRSLIMRESSGDPYAEADTQTGHGTARGLGQFIDSTAKQYIPDWKDPTDSYNPVKNIRGIYAYLSDLIDKTGNIEDALIRYHGGGTDVFGTKSDDYAREIMDKSGAASFKPKDYSDDELINMFSDEVISEYHRTGNYLGKSNTVKEATEYAQKLHKEQEDTLEDELPSSPWVGALKEGMKGIIRAPFEILRISNKMVKDSALEDNKNISRVIQDIKSFKSWGEPLADYSSINPETVSWITNLTGKQIMSDISKKDISNVKSYLNNALHDTMNRVKQAASKEATSQVYSKESFLKKGKYKNLPGFAGFVQSVVSNLPQLAATVGVSVVGTPLAGTVLMGTYIAGSSAEDLKEKNVSTEDAFKYSIYNSLAQMPLEQIGLGKITKYIKGSGLMSGGIKKFINVPLTEFITEALQKYPEAISEIWAVNPDKSVKEKINILVDNLWEITKEAGYEGLIGATTGTAVTGGGRILFGPQNEKKITRDQKNEKGAQTAAEKVILDRLEEGKKPIETKPVEEQGNEEIETGRIFQEEEAPIVDLEEDVEFDEGPSFFNRGSAENFVEDYNEMSEVEQDYMISRLTKEEKAEVDKLLKEESDVKRTETGQEAETEYEATVDIPKERSELKEAPTDVTEKTTKPIKKKTKKEKKKPTGEVSEERKQQIYGYVRKDIQKSQKQAESKVIEGGEEKVRPASGEEIQEGFEAKINIREPFKSSDEEMSVKEEVEIPKKTPKKVYSGKELIDLAKSNKYSGPKKVKTLLSESGIKVKKGQKWYTAAIDYAKKFGSGEDVVDIDDYAKTQASKPVVAKSQKTVEKFKSGEDTRSEKKKNTSNLLREIVDDGLVEYDKNKHKDIIKNITKDEDGNIKTQFTEKQYNNALEVVEVNNKQYIQVKEKTVKSGGKTYQFSGTDVLQDIDISSGGEQKGVSGKSVEYTEAGGEDITEDEGGLQDIGIVNKNNEVIIDSDKIISGQRTQRTYTENEENLKSTAKEARAMLYEQLENEEITGEEYESKLRTLQQMEQDYGLEDYGEDFDTVRYSKKPITKIDRTKPIDFITGTEVDHSKHKNIAHKLGLKFNGIQEGIRQGNNIIHEATAVYTDKKGGHNTIAVPLNANVKDIKNRMLEAENRTVLIKTESDVKKAVEQVRRIFKENKDNVPNVYVATKVIDKNGKILHQLGKNTEGAIISKPEIGQMILINPNIETEKILPTVVHELVGHYGAFEVLNSIDLKLANHAWDIFRKDSKSKRIKALRNAEYKEKELFDEWIANNIEQVSKEYFDENGNFIKEVYNNDKSVVKKVYDFIKRLAGKIYDKWLGKKAKDQEIIDLSKAIIQRVGEVRKSNVPTRESRKKTHRGVKTKQRLKSYATDVMKIMNVENVDDMHLRFFEFANKHFYGRKADSYRRQIFQMMDKVKEVGDESFKKVLSAVEEFSDWQEARQLYSELRKSQRYNKKILSKNTHELSVLKSTLTETNKRFQMFEEYQTLKRLYDRGEVDRPYKRGSTTEFASPGDAYRPLVENGYVDRESFESGGYSLSDKGKSRYHHLNEILRDSNGDMFGIKNISNTLRMLRDITQNYRENVKKINISRSKTVEKAVKELKNNIKTLKDKYIPDNSKRKTMEYIRGTNLNMVNLEYITNLLDNFDDNGVFTKYIYKPLDKGRTKSLAIGQKWTDFIQKNLSSIKKEELIKYSPSFQAGYLGYIEKKLNKNRKPIHHDVEIGGRKVSLTPSQMISAYMIAKNKYGLRHLLNGGFSLAKDSKTIKITSQELGKIIEFVKNNENYMKVANTFASYFDGMSRDINRVSREDVGHDIATEAFYHPLLVKSEAITKELNEVKSLNDMREVSVRGFVPSNLKERVNSDDPIVLEGVFEAFGRTAPMVEQYAGSMMTSKAVYNILENKEFKKEMLNKGYGTELRKMLEIFNASSRRNFESYHAGIRTLRSIQNIFTVATLGYKAGTAALQLPSAMMYLTVGHEHVSFKDLFTNFKTSDKVSLNEYKNIIMKYSPTLRNRFEGHIDRDIGEYANTASARKRVVGKKGGIRKILSAEGAMSWITFMDGLAISSIWKAVEIEANKKGLKYGTDEFYKYVAPRAEEIVRKTQPTYDILDRPLITNSWYLKPLTMFTSQLIKNFMMTRRAVHKIKNGNHQDGFRDLMLVLVVQPLMVASIRDIWRNSRGKEDDDDDDSIFKKWYGKILLNDIAMIPIVGPTLKSALEGYGVDIGGAPQELGESIAAIGKNLSKAVTDDDFDKEKTLKSLHKLVKFFIATSLIEDPIRILNHSIKMVEDMK